MNQLEIIEQALIQAKSTIEKLVEERDEAVKLLREVRHTAKFKFPLYTPPTPWMLANEKAGAFLARIEQDCSHSADPQPSVFDTIEGVDFHYFLSTLRRFLNNELVSEEVREALLFNVGLIEDHMAEHPQAPVVEVPILDCRCMCEACEARTKETYNLTIKCYNCGWDGVALIRKGDGFPSTKDCPNCGNMRLHTLLTSRQGGQ